MPRLTSPDIASYILQVLVSAFLAILFLQSGIDKVVDRRGNRAYFEQHFAKSPLAGTVGPMLTVITLLEISAGALSGMGCVVLILTHDSMVAYLGALVGAIAALMEKANKAPKNTHVIGAVGGISIPPVNHYIAGYKWAATMEDPSIKVLVGYSNDFTDPAKCKNVASSQISAKSDILFQVAGGCGLGVLQAAGQAGVYSVGVDADQKDADPSVIASALKKVDVATYTAIQNVVNGKFTGGALTFSIANDGAGYAVDNLNVPADIQTALDDLKAKIKAGTLTPPADIPA